ncbi:MAG: DegT/DnrJ/EryC1/StrS family aminotransferase [bacterium]
MNIPLYKPYIGDEEKGAVLRVLKSRKLSRGKEVENFEKEFAQYVGKKYAIALNSGTSGLHVLVRAMGWKEGDEIITTPFSYVASANALLLEKITPVFVDIDPLTLNIDPKKIEEKITPKTKGILLVHILGLPVDVVAIQKIKEKYNLQIIEDACEAIGRIGDDFTVSQIGEASVYAFHENKQLTTAGEGGMIVTDNAELAQKCCSMRDQGRSIKKDWISNVILGYNFRLTEMQAAFGREQLKRIDRMLVKRESLAKKYADLLTGFKGLTTPQQMSPMKRSWFLYFVVFENQTVRDRIHQKLERAVIGSSTNYFPPIYNFPMYSNCKKDCDNAERISSTLLALPMFYEMSDCDVERVVDVIKANL